ncbi:MAG: hypothetical protein M1269_06535 [Chloroflexi bacterium]|nr:hypothetical protein [Chloroflexota bacterium]
MKLHGKAIKYIDYLCFSDQTRNLAHLLNRKIYEADDISIHAPSHPGGFARDLYKRRISIAEAYIKILHALDSGRSRERLNALKYLADQSLHAKTVRMPLNTARVQVALMKEAVKSADEIRRQLELLNDFSNASFGEDAVIRTLLKEMGLIEVPETSPVLKDMKMGWDWHVHDSLSTGRKTPTQLLLDAFIKGMSEITIAYYDIEDRQVIDEAYSAGDIIGIKVNVVVEFNTGQKGKRRHYMFFPPGCKNSSDFFDFFEKHSASLKKFTKGLTENTERRKETIDLILHIFNEKHLTSINKGYDGNDLLQLQPLKWADLDDIIHYTQVARMHLSELLYRKYKPVLLKRVLYHKALKERAETRLRQKEISQWEYDVIDSQYNDVRKEYQSLSSELIEEKYLNEKHLKDYDSVFTTEEDILPELIETGVDIFYVHPLEHGMKNGVNTLIKNHRYITGVETFNMRDGGKLNPSDIRLFNDIVSNLNSGNIKELKHTLNDLEITDIPESLMEEACAHYGKNPLKPTIGSASTGRNPLIPGMGFIESYKIPKTMRRYYTERHDILPLPVSALYLSEGKPVEEDVGRHTIVSMGKSTEHIDNKVGDEEEELEIGPVRLWRFLNPALKGIIKAGIGFVPAYLTVGWMYACIWYGITFTRNVIVDMVAANGLNVREWKFKDINIDNATSSLFWTGFSVPILGTVKHIFDLAWPVVSGGTSMLREFVKFFFIAFANGTYIATHNRLRNFDPSVIRGNFFRSILSWPLAAIFSPLGDWMTVPSIVQAKFWSDFVAGIIEGTGKLRKRLVLRKRDILELLPMLDSPDKKKSLTAMLDILFIWAKRRRGKTIIYQILTGKDVPLFKRTLSAFSKNNIKHGTDMTRYLEKLKDLFNDEGDFLALEKHILCNYHRKEAVRLSELLGRYYSPFARWLEKIQAPER